MKNRSLFIILTITILVAGVMAPRQAAATPITVDEIIYQPGVGLNVSSLSATANMSYSGNFLSITVTNTSNDTGATGAIILLSGFAFNLPNGLSINTSGTHSASIPAGSFFYDKNTVVASAPTSPLNEEWGYDNAPINGPFVAYPVLGTVNTTVATLKASVEKDLNNGSPNSPNINGPSFGLLSKNDNPIDKGGQEGIQDSLLIQLQLTGSYSGNLLQYIQDNHVVASFGSPTTNQNVVPEPMSLVLLGSGLALIGGLGLHRRKK